MKTSRLKISLFNAANYRHCPQCGGVMKEVEKRKEGLTTYVWLECVKANCDGQWLRTYANLLPLQFQQTAAQGKLS